MKHIHQISMLLASTRKWLANRDTLKVLTKIQVSKSILQLAATNCVQQCIPVKNRVCIVNAYNSSSSSAFQSKLGYSLLMRTNAKTLANPIFNLKRYIYTYTTTNAVSFDQSEGSFLILMSSLNDQATLLEYDTLNLCLRSITCNL